MVRKNKNKIGGKLSALSTGHSLDSPTLNISNSKSQGKINFYDKYCNDKVQQNLVNAMSVLLAKMAKSKNENEQAFVESLKDNANMLPFLTSQLPIKISWCHLHTLSYSSIGGH